MSFETILSTLESSFFEFGYLLVFLGVLIETTPFGGLIPGALLAAMGGFYSYEGPLRLSLVLLLGVLGMVVTLASAYVIGGKTGMRLAKYLKQEENVKKAKYLIEEHGPMIITTALLSNITRFWIAYIAGMQRYNFMQFLLYTVIASFAWVSLLVISGYLAASGAHSVQRNLAQVSILSWIFLAITGAVITWALKKQIKEGRKELESE